ncbi:MAG: hypothetical protein JOZ84_16405 [Methylobacteriaceae bacterium]|nr:hypothetical protein [Methylobacteriaceae bacterium]
MPAFPGVCALKKIAEIGDPAKKAVSARFDRSVSKADFRISGFFFKNKLITGCGGFSDFLKLRLQRKAS